MPKKKESWFEHRQNEIDKNAGLEAMVFQYGMTGYGYYWRLWEILRAQEGYRYDIQHKFSYTALAKDLITTADKVKEYIDSCINDFELLATDGEYIWSPELSHRMSPMDAKVEHLRANGRKGAEKRHGKGTDKPEGQQTIFPEPSTPAPIPATPGKQIRKDYEKIEKTKQAVYDFIRDNRPEFIEPYVDMWNIFAGERDVPKVSAISETRRRSFNVRIKEKSFDFLSMLAKASKSEMCLTGQWFTFDWLIKNQSNYIKLLEGNYDNKNEKKPEQPTNASDERLEAALKRKQQWQ